MITNQPHPDGNQFMVVLRPNQSWSWRSNVYLIASLLAISLTVGIVFLLQEYWLILPFTLAEVALVAACLYYCVRRTHQQEVLTLTRDTVTLERGIRQPELQQQFHRYFTRFFVHPPRFRGHSQVIALRCKGEELEIGSFLSNSEKDELVAVLREIIVQLDRPQRA
ncbi:MAG: DUF2244 domain-containing protein [Pseudomonadales bacterium]